MAAKKPRRGRVALTERERDTGGGCAAAGESGDAGGPVVAPVERFRMPARSDARWWAGYVAVVEHETGLPIDHPDWTFLASRHVGVHLEHDRHAKDEAAKRAHFLRDQLRAWTEQFHDQTQYATVRREVRDRDGAPPPALFELLWELPHAPLPAVETRGTWLDALCREYEVTTLLIIRRLEGIARQVRVDDPPAALRATGPKADCELRDAARSLFAVISHRWPQCRRPWHVTAALLRCHGWEWGHGSLSARAEALRKRCS